MYNDINLKWLYSTIILHCCFLSLVFIAGTPRHLQAVSANNDSTYTIDSTGSENDPIELEILKASNNESITTDITFNILVLDDYTQAPLEGAIVKLLHEGVTLSSAQSNSEGYTQITIKHTGIEPQQGKPASFSLSDNYPNPFDAQTNVELAVPENQTLNISVYNIIGQRVSVLTIPFVAGFYTLNFTLSHLPTGVYFLRISGAESHTMKLLKAGNAVNHTGQILSVQAGSSQQFASSVVHRPESGYTIQVTKDNYDIKDIAAPVSQDTIRVQMSRNNQVVFEVEENERSLNYEIKVNREEEDYVLFTPDTLLLKSGIYTVFGQTDSSVVSNEVEVASNDTTIILITKKYSPSDDNDVLLTSPDLIADALHRGEIDYPTSLLYRAYALVGHPHLPSQYVGNVISLDDGTSLFLEILNNQNELNQETLGALAPFMARPNDPISIFSTGLPENNGMNKSLPQIESWISTPAAGGQARVWVPADRALEVDFSGTVDEVWQALFHDTGIIKLPIPDQPEDPSEEINPDNAIDIYFVPLNSLDPRREGCDDNPNKDFCKFYDAGGWAVHTKPFNYDKETSSGWILIDFDARGDFLIGTIAHELFHVSQFGYNYSQPSWLLESTATWGEFTTLRELGRSPQHIRDRIPGFFSRLRTRRLDSEEPDIHKYSAYLYPLFIQMERGHLAIDAVWWEAHEGANGIHAIDDVLPFREHFKDFALRNWNRDPVSPLYNEIDPNFPPLQIPFTESMQIGMEQEMSLQEELIPLSMTYNLLEVDLQEDAIQMLRIDLSQITSNPDAGVDAIVKIEGREPEVHRWSDESQVQFCLDYEPERVEDIVIILSNASIEADLDAEIKFDTKDPCPAFAGVINYTRTISGGFDNEEWNLLSTARINFELNSDPDHPDSPNHFHVTSGSVNWTHKDNRIIKTTCDGEPIVEFYEAEGSGRYNLPEGQGVTLRWRVPQSERYGLLVSHTTIGMGNGPPYEYFGRSTICGEWTEGTWFSFAFITPGSTSEPIPEEDELIGFHKWERQYAGVLPEVITIDWEIKRYFEE